MLILLTHVIESPDLNLHVYTYIRSELKSKLNRGNRTICATNFVITITILTQIIVIYPWYTHYFFIALFFIIIKPTMCVATWNVAAKSSSFNFGHTSCKILLLWFLEPKIKNCSSPEKLNMYVDLFWFFETYLCDEERNSLEEITPMTKNTFDIRWKRTTKTQTSILKMTSQLWPKIIIGGISASQFFLRSESEQEFKWFTVKRQASNW